MASFEQFEKLYTVEETAKVLRVSVSTVYKRVPHVKIGGVKIRQSTINDIIANGLPKNREEYDVSDKHKRARKKAGDKNYPWQ